MDATLTGAKVKIYYKGENKMTTCEFKTNNEAQNNEVMDKLWNAIQSWMEDERKELVLCRWQDKEGYHVAVSAGDKADLRISIKPMVYEINGKCYTVTLGLKGEEKQIEIPADVVARVYNDDQHKEPIDTRIIEDDNLFARTHDTAEKLLDEYERQYRNEGCVTGLSTGFYDLDYRTRGLQDRELILIAGSERKEKLGFALSLIHNVLKDDVTTVVFSPSLTRKLVINNLMSIDLGVDPRNIGNRVSESRLRESTRLLEYAPLYIDDNPSITIDLIRKTCFKLSEKTKLGLVVIDCLELINDDTYASNDRSVKLRKLKSFARKIHCPVLVLSELTFSTLKSLLDRPNMQSVPMFDESQKYPDVMMLLYPDSDQNNRKYGNEKGEAELIVINQGEFDGRVRLLMDLGGLRFRNKV